MSLDGEHIVRAPTFDTLNFLWGGFQGAIGALPTDNLVQLCYLNITYSISNWTDTYNAASVQQWQNMITAFQWILRAFYGISFSCIYSFISFVDPAMYEALFGSSEVLFNILFNLGYIYNDVKNVVE